MKRYYVLGILIGMCFGCLALSAQTEDAETVLHLQLVDVQHIGDIVEGRPHLSVISPDGQLLATEGTDRNNDPALCIYTFSTRQTDCTAYPAEDANGERIRIDRPIGFKWSLDSNFIALTENFITFFVDSDIWLFDVQNHQFMDRTDDGFSGGVPLSGESTDLPFDVLPTWSPNGNLYFFRYMRGTDDERYTQLYTIPQNTGSFAGIIGNDQDEVADPVLIADYTDSAPTWIAFFDYPNGYSLQGAAAVSPDGTRMAVLMRPQQLDMGEVWIIDLSNGEILRRIPTLAFSGLGLPDWTENQGFVAEGVVWTDNNALIVNFINPIMVTSISWTAYHLDLVTDKFTPIFDYSAIPSEGDYVESDAYAHPRYAALTPNGDYLLYVTLPNSSPGARLEAVPVLGGDPIVLHDFGDDFDVTPALFTSIGTDGQTVRALIFGYVFTFEVTE